MSKSFGTNFLLVSDVQFQIDPNRTWLGGGPWIHLGTAIRGVKEYMCFKHAVTDAVYIEELDEKEPGLFKAISDPQEREDIEAFFRAAGVLGMGVGLEFKVGKSP